MRTTITLDEDALKVAKAKAAHDNVTLGKAVSDLILQAIREPAPSRKGPQSRAIFRSEGGVYTSVEVQASLDEE
jgi:hypothetical protein